MKKLNRVFMLLLVALLISDTLVAQCDGKSKHIGWLSKMLRVHFTITEPANITYTTKPASIYEAPFAFVVFASFVKADNNPFFYVWTTKDHYVENTDFKKGDKITFYLSDGSKIESSCFSDYDGKKGKPSAFINYKKMTLVI